MVCEDVLDLVEPIAAGDLQPDEQVRAHLQTCITCAAALASARRLEAALQAMEVPAAPATFTGAVLQRIRHDKWQSEQNVDRLFNVAIVLAVMLVAGAVAAMLNVDALLGVSASAWAVLKDGTSRAMQQAAPALATYIAAAGLMASALGMWWWAERRLQF